MNAATGVTKCLGPKAIAMELSERNTEWVFRVVRTNPRLKVPRRMVQSGRMKRLSGAYHGMALPQPILGLPSNISK